MFGKSKVRINYKSGRSVVVKCKDFTVTRRGSEITGLKWEEIEPNALFIGLDEIESVWAL